MSRRALSNTARVLAVLALLSGLATVSTAVPLLTATPTQATFQYPTDRVLEAPIEDPEVAASAALPTTAKPVPTPRTTPSGPSMQSFGLGAPPRPKFDVLVIGHRGAPAYRPQHTLEGYQLAITQGADFVETDLVMTKDAKLVARHESDITETTDVRGRPEFADRAKNGRWHTEDFTLAELKTLKATGGPAAYSGKYAIPTLDEIIALVRRQPRRVGLYLELKAPAYFRGIDLPMEEKLARALTSAGWTNPSAPVFVESLDATSLRRLHRLTEVRLTQLLWGNDSAPPIRDAQLTEIATYASVIGIDRDRLRPYLTAVPPADRNLITQAKAQGLAVHVFTFGYQNPYGTMITPRSQHPADPPAWAPAIPMYRAFYALGVAAVFTDTPNIAVYAKG